MLLFKVIKISILILLILPVASLNFAQSSDDIPIIRFSIGENDGFDNIIINRVASHLEELGYEIELLPFSSTELKIEAVAIGQADIVHTTSHPAWLARTQDIPIVTVLEFIPANWVFVGSLDIQTCDDWDGAIVAHHSETSLTAAIGNYYAETFCPDANLEIVYIRGSANRAAALMGEAVDLTVATIDAILPLLEEAPDDIHITANLIQELSWIIGQTLNVSESFIENHPEAVQDIVTAFILVLRDIVDDPESFIDDVVIQLELDPEEAMALVDIYIDNGLFAQDGGLTEERITKTIDFLVSSGFLPEGLTADDVADLTFIEAALVELDSE